METVPTRGTGWRTTVAACVLVALGVAAAHGGAAGNDFVALDDDVYIYGNPMVQAGLTPASVRAAFELGQAQTYFHPLTWLSLMADRQLLGPGPVGFHVVNVLLHTVVAVCLLLVLSRATGRLGAATAAALLFAVHPLTVEAVSWATERKTVLSTALAMLALLAYVRYARTPSWRWLAVVDLLFAAAMLAKPGIVVLPVLLLLIDVWPLGRIGGVREGNSPPPRFPPVGLGRAVLEKLPAVVVALLLLAVAIGSVAPMASLGVTLEVRAANAVAAVPRYLWAAFWPADLGPFHVYRAKVDVGWTVAGCVIVAALLAAGVSLRRRAPALAFGIAWFLIGLLPYLGLRQAGLWPSWADRFAYVPLMGLTAGIVYTVASWAERSSRRRMTAAAVAVALAAVLGVATRNQVGHWRDSVTLFRRIVKLEPSSVLMRFNLGTALLFRGDNPEAAAVLAEALKADPFNSVGHAYLGLARSALGLRAEAEASLQTSLRLDPRRTEALVGLGDLYWGDGDLRTAREYYRRLVAVATPAEQAFREHALARLRN